VAVANKVRGTDKVIARLEALKNPSPLKQAVLAGALMVESTAKESIAHGSHTGAIYKRGNVSHQASAPGETPATDTGAFISSINHWESDNGLTVSVGSLLGYSADLEYGTKNMGARPWLHPALDANRKAIIARIKQALIPRKT
jgi:hypothetical protein